MERSPWKQPEGEPGVSSESKKEAQARLRQGEGGGTWAERPRFGAHPAPYGDVLREQQEEGGSLKLVQRSALLSPKSLSPPPVGGRQAAQALNSTWFNYSL